MDDQHQANNARQSGLPRPSSRLPIHSKLPVPRSTSVRATPSRESLTGTTTLRNPKLRSTPSQDHLASAASSRPAASHTRPVPGQPSSSRLSLSRSVGNLRSSASGIRNTQDVGAQRKGAMGPPPSYTSVGARTPGQLTSTRRPLEQTRRSPSISADRESLPAQPSPQAHMGPPTKAAEADWGAPREKRPTSMKPRLSLAERTVETLAQLPSSPALKNKGSAFFDPDSAKKRPASRAGSSRPSSSHRPGSSHSQGSFRAPSRPASRPSSSSGPDDNMSNFRASTNTYRNPLSTIEGTPSRGRVNVKSLKTPLMKASQGSTVRDAATRTISAGIPSRSKTPSPERQAYNAPVSTYGSKTLAARPARSRPSMTGLFKKPSTPALDRGHVGEKGDAPRKISSASQRSSATSETNPSGASTTSASTALTMDSAESPSVASSRKSSAALREQIAKAKAAKRAAASRQVSLSHDIPEQPPLIPTDTTFDFGLSNDPFNQQKDDSSKKKILQSRIETARTSGRLNIAAMGLREIPAEVMNMYSLDSIGRYDGAWAESVDLTRFVAADNELEMIDDSIFPDCDPQDMADSEDGQGNIFGGLETLDLHGNMLIALPMGLRRLPQLTSLNLSQNRLSNNCLEVLSQITSLKDLKLGGNLLYGPLDPSFSNLENLEIVDLHGNNISSLPSNLGNLSRLRILNISENCFETLPFEILASLPLTELIARKNQLSGTLIEETVESFATLQSLDVSANQLTHLTSFGRSIGFPSLHQLCVSMNRLQALPDIGSWTSLITLSADENSINAIPEGFIQLQNLKSVDFSSNDIRVIPPEVGRMENLLMLQLSANPLRDKKFSSISTEDMKHILAARLEPAPAEDVPEDYPSPGTDETVVPYNPARRHDTSATTQQDYDDHDDSRSDLDDFATPPTSAPHSPTGFRSRSQTLSSQTWPIKVGGVLDRSNTQISALHPVICSKVAASTTVREVQLHHNLFTALPDSLSFFAETLTCLSLAHNQLTGETYLGGPSGNDSLELPFLKELNLSSNYITSLAPLVTHLQAPLLEKLDVSLNRISALPPGTQLRDAFPNLAILFASNNHLISIEPESIKGMRIVNAANNDISHLNPRIGLLGGGSGGLEKLDVSGNRFRVPRWNVLELGTEATLRWLRARVPVAEMGAWKEANGQTDDDDGDADVD